MDVKYIDRETGQIEVEKIYGRWALALLYGESRFSRVVAFLLLPLIARIPWFSQWYGYLQTKPKSAKKVKSFIQTYSINIEEFEDSSFPSFNAFFIRKLKKDARPIIPGPYSAVLPADGRYLVFPDLQKVEGFYVKGQQFSLEEFLQDAAITRQFFGGSMVIGRLCPTDYHRFHFACSGIPGQARLISGPLFSVNPIALSKRLRVLWENKRMVTHMATDHFGLVLCVEIGATCVGSIHQTYWPGDRVEKGEEKGYFSFGGSCIVLLFERGRIQFDADLIHNSKKYLETRALFGSSLGTIPK